MRLNTVPVNSNLLQPVSPFKEQEELIELAARLAVMAEGEMTPDNITSMIYATADMQERLLSLEK